MLINRIWAMPNKHTFTIKPIKELIITYMGLNTGIWGDPFAGANSPAQITNDLNPDVKAQYCEDAISFLKRFSDHNFSGILFDPPYSITQAQQCYKSYGKEKLKVSPSNMQYWKLIKNEINRVLKPSGIVICCGWSSQGLGKGRGYEILEILLVPHGGSKNDTIVTVERKIS